MNKFQTLVEQSLTERAYNDYDGMKENLFDAYIATDQLSPTDCSKMADSAIGACIMLAADAELPDEAFVGNHTPMAWAKSFRVNPMQHLNAQQVNGFKNASKVILDNVVSLGSYNTNRFDASVKDNYLKMLSNVR